MKTTSWRGHLKQIMIHYETFYVKSDSNAINFFFLKATQHLSDFRTFFYTILTCHPNQVNHNN